MMFLLSLVFLASAVSSGYAQITCVCVMTSCDSCPLNVRDGPSTGSNIIGEVFPKDCLEMQETSCSGGWCHVLYSGADAYVSSDYVSPAQACAHPTKAPSFCMAKHCGSSGSNEQRECDAYGCGHYGAPRGDRLHYGSDVVCDGVGTRLNAPFDGYVLQSVPPYGDGSCCDDGFEFLATDPAWEGYSIVVFYATGYTLGAEARQGEQIATHTDLQCGCYPSTMTDHSHVEVYDGPSSNDRLDPTSFLYCQFK